MSATGEWHSLRSVHAVLLAAGALLIVAGLWLLPSAFSPERAVTRDVHAAQHAAAPVEPRPTPSEPVARRPNEPEVQPLDAPPPSLEAADPTPGREQRSAARRTVFSRSRRVNSVLDAPIAPPED